MIDTLKLTPADARLLGRVPLEWRESIYPGAPPVVAPNGKVYGSQTRRTLVDRRTGLRVYGDEESVRSVEFSAPRQLYATNGHLLDSQAQVDAALSAMHNRLREVAEVGLEGFVAKRVDLVWHFAIEPSAVVVAYRDYRFPGINALPTVHPEESITWSGTDLRATLYDKAREARVAPRSITRLEFQLSGRVLRREFGGDVTRIDFQQCYQVFRRLASKLEPKRVPKLSKIAALLAFCEQQGVPATEFWLRGKSAPTARTIRRQVSACRLEYAEISLLDHLPADGPLPPIHVEGARNKMKTAEPSAPTRDAQNFDSTIDNQQFA